MIRRSERSIATGAARMRRPTCCRFRPRRRPGKGAESAAAHISATSSSPIRRPRARRRPRASRSATISPTSPSMDFCICSAMTTRTTATPKRWNSLERRILARLAVPDPYAPRADRKLISPPCLIPTRRAGRLSRPALRANRAIFRCRSPRPIDAARAKASSRALRARCSAGGTARPAPTSRSCSKRPAPAKPASRRKSAPCSRTSWRCASAGSRTSWCRAPTSSPCSRTSRSANWSRCSRRPAIRGSSSTTTRSTIRSAWCTSAT